MVPSAGAAAAASAGIKAPSLPSVSLPSLPSLGGRTANDTTEVCPSACSNLQRVYQDVTCEVFGC